MNRNRYQITEHWQNWPYGTENRIVARGATLKSCVAEYCKHLKTWELARVDRKAINTQLYFHGVPIELAMIEEVAA